VPWDDPYAPPKDPDDDEENVDAGEKEQTTRTCPQCNGMGRVKGMTCPRCKGSGRIAVSDTEDEEEDKNVSYRKWLYGFINE
jgi:RecJ-like exonuclease